VSVPLVDRCGPRRSWWCRRLPAILPRSEWDRIEHGLSQRVIALNLFLQDIYGRQQILKDRQIPRELVYSCQHFRREMMGIEVPRGIHTHISGIDLVRDSKTGEMVVLEDNVRTPKWHFLRAGEPPRDDPHLP